MKNLFSQSIIASFSLLFIISCDFISEPERLINEHATPPRVGIYQFQNFSNGQHVDGTIYFEVNTDSIDFEITEVRLFVDDNLTGYDLQEPYLFELNTRNYSEGLHQLSVGIFKEKRDHGMLNLLYLPSVVLNIDLFYDRTPPQAVVVNVSKSDDGKVALLNWTESTNQNFAAYRIYRSFNYDNDLNVIDTIYQKNQTTYSDSSLAEVYNLEITYMVEVSTSFSFENYTYTKQGNRDTVFYGRTLDFYNTGPRLKDIVMNKQLPEIYFVVNSNLLAFSTENQNLLRKTIIPNLQYSQPYSCFTISTDNSELFIFNPRDNTIIIIDTESFATLKTLNLQFHPSNDNGETNIYHLGGNKAVIITTDSVIRIIDTESGAVTDSSTSPFLTDFHSSTITDDRSLLIISQSFDTNAEYKIVTRDLSTNDLPIVNEKITDYYYNILKISSDSQILYGLNYSEGGVDARDFGSLEIISSINTIYGFHTFSIDEEKMYAITYKYIELPGLTMEGSELIRFNINSLEQEKSWLVVSTDWLSYPPVSSAHIYVGTVNGYSAAIAIPLEN